MVAQKKEPFGAGSDAGADVGHSKSDIDAIIDDIYEAVGSSNKAASGGAGDGATQDSGTTGSKTAVVGSSFGKGGGKAKKATNAVSEESKMGTDSESAPGSDSQAADTAKGAVESDNTDHLAKAQAEADQFKDRLVRLQAEWDNFRKRTAAERDSERQRAAAKLVERLLPIIDDLERAIEHSSSASDDSLKDGVFAVHSKLIDVLKKEGLATIDPVGEAFDANIHQAVGKVDDSSVHDETVTQVYQKGYQMGDKVLRSAMVVVSQGGPKRQADDEKK
jgi:molecular chaperone GrpE